MKLTGQQVVVGGSSGIGLAVARLAQENGGRVTIMGRSPERLQAASLALGGVSVITMDASNQDQVAQAFAAFDLIHHIYVAAGSTKLGGFLDAPLDDAMAPFVERIWGAMHIVRAAVRKIPAGGSITLTGGLSTDRPVAGAWVSGIGTATAEQFARVLALELAPIRFNAISPGYTDTPMWDRIFGDDKMTILSGIAEQLPVKHIASPEDVAEAILLLMTNRSITGESLHVDGGARLI